MTRAPRWGALAASAIAELRMFGRSPAPALRLLDDRYAPIAWLTHAVRRRDREIVLANATDRDRRRGHAHPDQSSGNISRPSVGQSLVVARRTRSIGVAGHLHARHAASAIDRRDLLQDRH